MTSLWGHRRVGRILKVAWKYPKEGAFSKYGGLHQTPRILCQGHSGMYFAHHDMWGLTALPPKGVPWRLTLPPQVSASCLDPCVFLTQDGGGCGCQIGRFEDEQIGHHLLEGPGIWSARSKWSAPIFSARATIDLGRILRGRTKMFLICTTGGRWWVTECPPYTRGLVFKLSKWCHICRFFDLFRILNLIISGIIGFEEMVNTCKQVTTDLMLVGWTSLN